MYIGIKYHVILAASVATQLRAKKLPRVGFENIFNSLGIFVSTRLV